MDVIVLHAGTSSLPLSLCLYRPIFPQQALAITANSDARLTARHAAMLAMLDCKHWPFLGIH